MLYYKIYWKERERLSQESISLNLLDVSLPDGYGFDICQEVKWNRDIPVIFLTARDEKTSVILGLDMGG